MPSSASKIILGIDPGLADTGYGIIEKKGSSLICKEYGSIKTKAGVALNKRLVSIAKQLNQIISEYQPEIIGVEQLFFCKNVKTALAVGHARGVVLLTAAQHNIALQEFTPLQVKSAITGYGQATKKQIQHMIKTTLNLKKIPTPDDAADALAIAICCTTKKIS